ncbi:MAG: hypothetical protein ACXIUB_06805 [Wenzhouxiangella sp.]
MSHPLTHQRGFIGKGFMALIVIILLGMLFLAVSKPSERDFHAWTRANIQAGENADLLERAFAFGVRTQARLETTYHDYAIFAIVETRMANRHRRFLGIAGQWIQIEDSE